MVSLLAALLPVQCQECCSHDRKGGRLEGGYGDLPEVTQVACQGSKDEELPPHDFTPKLSSERVDTEVEDVVVGTLSGEAMSDNGSASSKSYSDVCIDPEHDSDPSDPSNTSPKSSSSRRWNLGKGKTRKAAGGVILGGGDDDETGEIITSAALGINIDNPGKITDFYDVGRSIGEGSFGSVFKASVKATEAIRAVKRIPLPKAGRDKDTRLDFLKEEIRVAKLLDHPGIVKLFEVFEDHKSVYMVMELCRDGDLEEHVMEGGLSELDAATVMQQVLRGVAYMHAHKICHRDLKSENMLLVLRPPAKKGTKHAHSKFESAIRISDFGLSCSYEDGQVLKRNCGTDSHKAPQVYAHAYNYKCDVWACGVIMYFLLSCRLPFEGRDAEELHKKIMAAKVTWCQEWMSRSGEAMNLAKQMLMNNEANRMEAAQALKHKWFSKQVPRRRLAAVDQEILHSLRGFRKLNKFRKVSLAVIASMLPEKVIRPGRDLFVYLDKDGDGEVTLTELRESMEELKKNKPTDAGIASEEIFSDVRRKNTEPAAKPSLHKQASFQADGQYPAFSYTEFLAATFDRSKHSTEAVCRAAFRCFDKDGSGQLEPSELVDGYLLGKLEAEEVERIMEELDANGDGEIDFQEFMTMMSHQEPVSPTEATPKAS
ncbi:Calcium-dependent protein kinase 2 (PfCDPK2) [Durusdinium trenchii]|uniref:Calcium-dependent protein kinase 2 (PfCDPK2) n=1 Tax=Durusdinium trenchii TaxID=1381693 RepID=A0ABP0ILJ9_9DINO